MSNQVTKYKKEVAKREALLKNAMYFSCLGSCIATVAKLAQKTEKEIMDLFPQLQHNEDFAKSKNVQEAVEWLFNYFEIREDFKKYIVFVYDEKGIFTPVVTLCVDGSLLPLDPNGKIFGILSYKDHIIEYVFEDESNNNGEIDNV